jgi:hypothetical protein
VALGRRGGGATADDCAAAVHGRRGGALAEDGSGPGEKGRRPRGRQRRSTVRRGGALADDGGVVGGAAAVGDDSGAPRENLAA